MPLIPLYLSSEHIKNLHNYLIKVYKEEFPPVRIEPGINYAGTIENVCFIVSSNRIGDKKWSHFLEKAAYMFYHLNRGHPFIDGNKRTALLATFYFCLWNGYLLNIPEDADKIILAIADVKRKNITVEHAYNWILENTVCNLKTCLTHIFLVLLFLPEGIISRSLQNILNYFLYSWPHEKTLESLLNRTHMKYI